MMFHGVGITDKLVNIRIISDTNRERERETVGFRPQGGSSLMAEMATISSMA